MDWGVDDREKRDTIAEVEACSKFHRCVSGKIDDHKVRGIVEALDVRTREGDKDPRLVEHVGLVGNMSREVN